LSRDTAERRNNGAFIGASMGKLIKNKEGNDIKSDKCKNWIRYYSRVKT
jgi:hypothetical protein